MNTLRVTNIKCGGCEKSIISSLQKGGLKDISIDVSRQTVAFQGSLGDAKKILSKMGYPEAGSPEAKSLVKKAKSYYSCAIGRMK
jgi:copper chaperone CopZ